ncbi:MAG: helix-turn-helix domain-containing protein [Sphingobium sp.]|nr:helix-turn-helix domain-containing protein [Sphingobium sp.]
MTARAIPSFYLYGEPHQSVSDNFVHVELLDDRSRPSKWSIRPHAHADLYHIFLITSGGGTVRMEDKSIPLSCPAIIVVPATAVHAFDWVQESTGWVTTISRYYLNSITQQHHDLARHAAHPHILHLDADAARQAEAHMATLKQELGWSVRGHGAIIEATTLSLLALSLRQSDAQDARWVAAPSPSAALVARFRERVEARFRLREKISDYAAALNVSESSLRMACARIAHASPASILDDRSVLEARRALLYTNMSIAETGYALGFNDPAYFSRFFTKYVGLSPAQFRQDHRQHE